MTNVITTTTIPTLSALLAVCASSHAAWSAAEDDSAEDRTAHEAYDEACDAAHEAYDEACDAAQASLEACFAGVGVTCTYNAPSIKEVGGGTYAIHGAHVTIGGATAEAHSWSLCGWLRAGASSDLDGSGLANWGDSQRGGWSVCDGDGYESGRVRCASDALCLDLPAAVGGDDSELFPTAILGLSPEDATLVCLHLHCTDALRALAERVQSACDVARPTVSEPSGEDVWADLDNSCATLEIGDSVRVGRPWGEGQTLVVVEDGDGVKTAYLESDRWEEEVRKAVAKEAICQVRDRITRNDLREA